MLYKFKSKATGDVIMLEPNGRQILQIIGKDPAAGQGILLPEHMAAAISVLEAAIAQEEAAQQPGQEAEAGGAALPRAQGISLRQRATPFIAMVKRCQQANTELVWGV